MRRNYPDVLDSAQKMKSLLGTFWEDQFIAQTDLDAFLHARAVLARHIEQKTNELVDSRSRVRIHPFAVKKYRELNFDTADGTLHSTAYATGRPANYCLNYPVDATIEKVRLICRNPLGGKTYVEGVHFQLEDNHTITFVDDVTENNTVTTTWGREALVDEEDLWYQFGYLLGIKLDSGNQYKRLINAILTATINGPSYTTLVNFVRAVFDVPVAVGSETVEFVGQDQRSNLIITDRSVYRFSKTATATVSVGSAIVPGQFLTDAVTILTPPFTTIPSSLTSLALSGSMLHPSLTGTITLENTSKTLTVTTGVNGYTKLTWSMPGNVGDVNAFFDLLHAQGVAAGKTLANYLDIRPQPQADQPTAASLPTTINPLQFFLQSVVRNSFYVVVIKSAKLGSGVLSASVLNHVSKLMPPENAVIWAYV